jgi:lariat debranching enzyme
MPKRPEGGSSLNAALQMARAAAAAGPKATAPAGGAPPVAAAPSSLHIAVQGCCHGDLDKIYAACGAYEQAKGRKLDLLICCGDFQSVRDAADLNSMAVPEKYKVMGDFADYHACRKVAPLLTLFVGGNHEASNYLWEQYYGGFVAPNIYYMGHAGVVNVGGLRIAGLSGIFKGRDFFKPYSPPPYDHMTVREAYHVRSFEMEKLAALTGPVDVVLSHDWPVGITKYGNEAQLIRYKPYFEEDIRHGALGNPQAMALLRALRPAKWFAAHLHCRFTAEVPHGGASTTEFLALDKCTKGPDFLEFMTLPVRPPAAGAADRGGRFAVRVEHDAEWLAIVAASHAFVPVAGRRQYTQADQPALRAALTAAVQAAAAAEPRAAVVATNTGPLMELLQLPPVGAAFTPRVMTVDGVVAPGVGDNADLGWCEDC